MLNQDLESLLNRLVGIGREIERLEHNSGDFYQYYNHKKRDLLDNEYAEIVKLFSN